MKCHLYIYIYLYLFIYFGKQIYFYNIKLHSQYYYKTHCSQDMKKDMKNYQTNKILHCMQCSYSKHIIYNFHLYILWKRKIYIYIYINSYIILIKSHWLEWTKLIYIYTYIYIYIYIFTLTLWYSIYSCIIISINILTLRAASKIVKQIIIAQAFWAIIIITFFAIGNTTV